MSSRGKKKRAKENNLVCRGYFYLSRKEIIESDSEEKIRDINEYFLYENSELEKNYLKTVMSTFEAVRDNLGGPTFKEFTLDTLERFENQYLSKIDVDFVDFDDTANKWIKFWIRELLKNYWAIFVVSIEKCSEEIDNRIDNAGEVVEEVLENLDKEIKRLTQEIGID